MWLRGCCLLAQPQWSWLVLQDARTMIETNFLSVVVLTREVVKGMMARNKGHIVSGSSSSISSSSSLANAKLHKRQWQQQ
jgi:NADP-dependent 3-hydroxy acid dehydrogenase YdfG